jgi:hypothetical protein
MIEKYKIEDFIKDPINYNQHFIYKINSLSDLSQFFQEKISANEFKMLGNGAPIFLSHFEFLLKESIHSYAKEKDFNNFKKALSTYNNLCFFLDPNKNGALYHWTYVLKFYSICLTLLQTIISANYGESSSHKLKYLEYLLNSFEDFINYFDPNNNQNFLLYRITIIRIKLEYFNADLTDYLSLLELDKKAKRKSNIDFEEQEFIDRLLPDLIKKIPKNSVLEVLLRFSLLCPNSDMVKILKNKASDEGINKHLVDIEKGVTMANMGIDDIKEQTSLIPIIKESTDLLPEIRAILVTLQTSIKTIFELNRQNLEDAIKINNKVLIEENYSNISNQINTCLHQQEIISNSIKGFDLNSISDKLNHLNEMSKKDIAIAEFLIDKFDNSSLSILQICKVLEREILLNIFIPFKIKIMENKISIPKPDQIFDEKDSHNQRKISYNTLYNYLFKKSELTLGNFGIILSVSQSHTEIKLFKGLIEFIEQKYPSNSKNILDLINDTTKKDFYKKAELSVTLSQLRNYSAHPKDLISNDVDAILSKEQYVKVKEFLFLPENQLLVQLLKRPE